VILDGNRRWARASGADSSTGHRAGADRVLDFLGWCRELDIKVVTLWMLSTDNLSRPEDELTPLLEIIADLVDRLAASRAYRLNLVGALDLLPADTARRLKSAAAQTDPTPAIGLSADAVAGVPTTVNVAVGYGGRREIADAVRSLLHEHAARGTSIEELAEVLDVEHIAEHLYTRGQPDPDLVIRTSGEQRLSGFLLWQSAHSEFYFCEALWPEFREVDFLRAVRSYGRRERRFGS
jgi:short-chain Z-isoprenyl diphosphate synthase